MSDASKFRLDLPLILPEVRDLEDRCVGRLTRTLVGRPGIAEAHVVTGPAGSAQLCVHYHPDTISLSRVRELVQAAGAELSTRFAHLVITGDEPMHARAARGIAASLRAIEGVFEADVAASGVVRLEYDRQRVSEPELLDHAAALGIRAAGLVVAPTETRAAAGGGQRAEPAEIQNAKHDRPDGESDHAGHEHATGGMFGENSELIFAGTRRTAAGRGLADRARSSRTGLAATRLLRRGVWLRRLLHRPRGDRQPARAPLRDRHADAGGRRRRGGAGQMGRRRAAAVPVQPRSLARALRDGPGAQGDRGAGRAGAGDGHCAPRERHRGSRRRERCKWATW